ncbi:YidH family protein [Blastococcus mobilis]|uniref:Putative membrane protein n=1 Tax=Blastococcus mobilis TaxID=1938746 RepID=A0A239AJB8_9ACTN|nr:DUF202 domain-containing protein [Blastococcus mobilis]SNR95757.1 putative membrane protein [Blastococcus mobilis]
MATDRAPSATPSRWPAWVYEKGTEPDYRFSFANERTFLAWIRTALALLAAGVAVDAFPLSLAEEAQRALAALLTCSGIVSAVIGWVQWARSERAIRRGRPLPSNLWSPILGLVLAAVGLIVVVSLG